MNFEAFRKTVFMNSQDCYFYNKNGKTILAGIMRHFGYLYSENFSDSVLEEISKKYRKYTAIVNWLIGLQIILYLYLLVFPYYLQLAQLPFFIFGFVLSVVPLLFLYFNYLLVNKIYEKSLIKDFGPFQKVKFEPKLQNIPEKAFRAYLNMPRKSNYVLISVFLIFILYVFVPLGIMNLNLKGNYDMAIKVSNVYLKFVPISADVYQSRALAEFNNAQYAQAVKDFELSDKYSFSNENQYLILGVKTYYAPKEDVLNAYDKMILEAEAATTKYNLKGDKAVYLLKNGDYVEANKIFNELNIAFDNGEDIYFPIEKVYFYGAHAKKALGIYDNVDSDIEFAKRICKTCNYDYSTGLILKH